MQEVSGIKLEESPDHLDEATPKIKIVEYKSSPSPFKAGEPGTSTNKENTPVRQPS